MLRPRVDRLEQKLILLESRVDSLERFKMVAELASRAEKLGLKIEEDFSNFSIKKGETTLFKFHHNLTSIENAHSFLLGLECSSLAKSPKPRKTEPKKQSFIPLWGG